MLLPRKPTPNSAPKKSPSSRPKNSTESLNEIQSTKDKINGIKHNLNVIVDQLHHQRSYLTWAANGWGEIPTWVKIVSGILLFGTLLTIGIYAHIDILTAVTCVCAVVAVVTSVALDNHHAVEKKSRGQLKASIGQLADMLGTLIETLQSICEQLKTEIAHLKSEITRLSTSIDLLEKQVEKLSTQVQQLGMTSEQLSLTQEELLAVKSELALKIAELKVLINTLSLKVQELQTANDTFKSILSILSTQLKTNEEAQTLFVKQFNHLLKDTSNDFRHTLALLYNSQLELEKTRTALERCNLDYRDLLTRHETLFKKNVRLQQRMEKFIDEKIDPHKPLVKQVTCSSNSNRMFEKQIKSTRSLGETQCNPGLSVHQHKNP